MTPKPSHFLALVLLGIAISPVFGAYKITFHSAPMHETYRKGEEQESQLVVEKNGKTRTYGFMMGSELLLDQHEEGWVLLRCPKELNGVFVTSTLVRVHLDDGKTDVLVDQVIHLFSDQLGEAFVGVREQRPLDFQGTNPRKLFVLELKRAPFESHYHQVTTGSWLPSDNDLELEGGPEGWARLEAKWKKLIQIENGVLKYRPTPKSPFQTFTLKKKIQLH